MTEQPVHSPLGASSSERWMHCPGSVSLLDRLGASLDLDDPDYRREGTAAHEAAAYCLVNGLDAWEVAAAEFYEQHIDVEAATAIQVYLNTVRSLPEGQVRLVEYSMTNTLHPQYYGTVDCAILDGDTLYVNDYKHGQGVEVEAEWNTQIMYYGYGLLEKFPDVRQVEFRIIQPRILGRDPVQKWACSVDTLREWAVATLLPAMQRTGFDDSLEPGAWCRFCPAKAICPALRGVFRAFATAKAEDATVLTDEELGQEYQMVKAAEFRIKAIRQETFARLGRGKEVPGAKLIYGKTNRVWKDGAEKVFVSALGAEAYTKPELLSPAQMEKLPGQIPDMVTEWAYQPPGPLTVALATDKKPAVKVQSAADTFAAALERMKDE